MKEGIFIKTIDKNDYRYKLFRAFYSTAGERFPVTMRMDELGFSTDFFKYICEIDLDNSEIYILLDEICKPYLELCKSGLVDKPAN